MYKIDDHKVCDLERTNFKDLGWNESKIEEMLRTSIHMLTEDDNDSLLVVGQQVKNKAKGRSDLTAIDGNGKIVLIEVKRDIDDIKNRKEPFEFQAIRYAASYAMIDSIDELVKKIYSDYIENHKDEFKLLNELTSYELGIRKVTEFLNTNNSSFDLNKFNQKQRIILAAGEFDKQTLSAVSWLASNGLDIACYELIPYKIQEQIYIDSKKIIPVPNYKDYYVEILEKGDRKTKSSKDIVRTILPKIRELLDSDLVDITPGDIIQAKGKDDIAYLQANGTVNVGNEKGVNKSIQQWLREVYDWSSVATYNFALHLKSGKLLCDIREEYMDLLSETSE